VLRFRPYSVPLAFAFALEKPMPIEIVYIREEHIEGFWNCLDSVARERRWLGAFEGYPLDSMRKFVLGMIENDNAQYVALDGEKVVGWIDISPSRLPVSPHVGGLGMGIISAYRGQGIGKRLMNAALEKAKARGIKRVELEVFPHNTAGVALYKSVGFVEEGRRKNAALLDEGYVDLIMMALLFT
jgi:ribosomal protein S18 acetylase RimI-like enzyme